MGVPIHRGTMNRSVGQGVQVPVRHLSLLFLLAALHGRAQHCGYCNAGLIALRPHAAYSDELVPDLRITLLDSTGLPATYNHGLPYGDFARNNERPANWRSQRSWVEHGGFFFPFAGDTYTLVVPLGLVRNGWSVLVQDLNAAAVWPRFQQQVVPITTFECHPLCNTFNDTVYHPREGRPDFTPVDIILQTR